MADVNAHTRVIHEISKILQSQTWKKAASAYNGQGLQHGTPHLGPASAAHDVLVRLGMTAEATVPEGLVTNRSWLRHRIAKAREESDKGNSSNKRLSDEQATICRDLMKCQRCEGDFFDTPLHRFFQCEDNDNLTHKFVTDTNRLTHDASKESDVDQCKLFRGILPANLISPSIDWQEIDECKMQEILYFTTVLAESGFGGTDGSGRPEIDRWHTRIAAAAITFKDSTYTQVAALFSRVPGRQTVPRAKLWAMYNVVNRVAAAAAAAAAAATNIKQYIFYVDAQYVLTGIRSKITFTRRAPTATCGTYFTPHSNLCETLLDFAKLNPMF